MFGQPDRQRAMQRALQDHGMYPGPQWWRQQDALRAHRRFDRGVQLHRIRRQRDADDIVEPAGRSDRVHEVQAGTMPIGKARGALQRAAGNRREVGGDHDIGDGHGGAGRSSESRA
jgi:hypothetical protein